MTVGEFIRQLQDAVHAEGFTLNNVQLLDVHMYHKKDCIEVEIEDKNENGTILYIS